MDLPLSVDKISAKACELTRPLHEAIDLGDAERLEQLLTERPRAERARLCSLQNPCTLLAHAICTKQGGSLAEVLLREAGVEQLTVPCVPGDGWTPYHRALAGPVQAQVTGSVPKGPLNEALVEVLLWTRGAARHGTAWRGKARHFTIRMHRSCCVTVWRSG